MIFIISVGLAIIVTIIQQFTSNDRPHVEYLNLSGKIFKFELPVIDEGNEECMIDINLPDSTIAAEIYYKHLDANENWHLGKVVKINEKFSCVLPGQKANTKLLYYLKLTSSGKSYYLALNHPVTLRCQREVPKYFLFPQVIFMFLATIFACFAGLISLFNFESYKKYAKIAFYLYLFGSVILGLIVYIIALRNIFVKIEPYNNLSFYKNILIFLIWFCVFYINRKINFRYATFAACILTLIIYCIPLSALIALF